MPWVTIRPASCLAISALLLASCEAPRSNSSAAHGSVSVAPNARSLPRTQNNSAAPAPTVNASTSAIRPGPRLEHDTLVTPPGLDASSPHPLVLFLHGFGASGASFERFLGVAALSKRYGFSFVVPDGPIDRKGRRFWNASSACCDFDDLGPNHVSLLGAIPTALESSGAARFDQVVIVGFSNGAFMAHRLACDVPRVTGIVAIAGAIPGPTDPPCKPDRPVRVIAIHGDRDRTVPYAGGAVLSDAARVAPSAVETAKAWAGHNGCNGLLGPQRRDLVMGLDGTETRIESYQGCKAPVERWTVEGGDHLAVVSTSLVAAAVERILAK